VEQIQLKASDLATSHWDGVDAFIWRNFSLSAYDELRNGFRLRWWRRPSWIIEQIPSDDRHREEKFVTILSGAIDGEIFWLEAGAARARGPRDSGCGMKNSACAFRALRNRAS
jgi:hypothetical protein